MKPENTQKSKLYKHPREWHQVHLTGQHVKLHQRHLSHYGLPIQEEIKLYIFCLIIETGILIGQSVL